MKKLFSKRSGFTLVEIIVAFAVFAVMSGMILSMIRVTVSERQSNMDFAKDTEVKSKYLSTHYIGEEDKYDKDKEVEGATGTFNLKFVDTETDGVLCDVSMDYGTRTYDIEYDEYGEVSKAEISRELDGVNYFVGNTVYDSEGGIDDGPKTDDIVGAFGNGQSSRYDTRLSGSKGLEYIKIFKVVKDETFNEPGKTRYLIECAASNPLPQLGTAVSPADTVFLQYKLRFCCSDVFDEQTITSGDKTYLYKIPKEAKIADFGYVNNSNLVWSDVTCESYTEYVPSHDVGDNYNKYTVEQISESTIRIGVPFKSGYDRGFSGSDKTRFYVVFEEDKAEGIPADPKLTTKSFGSNATEDGTASKYTSFPIYENDKATDRLNPNIYGAYIYTKEEQ